MFLIFINFILYKTQFLQIFYYYDDNRSNIEIYKEKFKYSINNIFELII